MSAPPPEDTDPEGPPPVLARGEPPLLKKGLATFALLLVGFTALIAGYGRLRPVIASIANLSDEGEVKRIAKATPPTIAADDDVAARGAYVLARRRALEAFEAREALLGPIARGEGPDAPLGLRLARLHAWSELRRIWASACAEAGLPLARYRALDGELASSEREVVLRRLLAAPETPR